MFGGSNPIAHFVWRLARDLKQKNDMVITWARTLCSHYGLTTVGQAIKLILAPYFFCFGNLNSKFQSILTEVVASILRRLANKILGQ